MNRSYTELMKLNTFKERYDYLKLEGGVGHATFGYERHINQVLYGSRRWKRTRDNIIIRDSGCDLGVDDLEIRDKIIIHHINPITPDDVKYDRACLYDPENLISTRHKTHNGIHFGVDEIPESELVIRRPGDTKLW